MSKYLYSTLVALISLLVLHGGAHAANPPTVKIRVAQYAKSLEIVMPKGGQW